MDNKVTELIHKKLDGIATPEEQAALSACLAGDPDAQALYDELVALAGMLDQVEAREPPPHLKQAILEALPVHKYASIPLREQRGWWASLREALWVRPQFTLAYAFSIGLLLGVGGYALIAYVAPFTPADSLHLYGTLVASDSGEDATIIEEVTLDRDAVHGTVQVKTTGDLLLIELALEVVQPVEVYLAFEEQAFHWHGIQQRILGGSPSLVVQAGQVRIETQGKQTYTLVFTDNDASSSYIHLQIRAGSDALYEKSLRARPD